ncbi:MAG: ATP-binding protein [Planctomycetota bacterium]
MSLPTFHELWQKLCAADESAEIEAKRTEELGRDLWPTVSAFANEPDRGGGYLLLGAARKTNALWPDYEVVGIHDADKIQADLATQCREVFNVPIRPEISIEQHDGKNVIVVHVPEAADCDKPVYIKSKGLPKGAYRRIGSTDQICTDDDIAMFYQARGGRSYDETPCRTRRSTTLTFALSGSTGGFVRKRARNPSSSVTPTRTFFMRLAPPRASMGACASRLPA